VLAWCFAIAPVPKARAQHSNGDENSQEYLRNHHVVIAERVKARIVASEWEKDDEAYEI
jgi:hypothetical protein